MKEKSNQFLTTKPGPNNAGRGDTNYNETKHQPLVKPPNEDNTTLNGDIHAYNNDNKEMKHRVPIIAYVTTPNRTKLNKEIDTPNQ